ncbi:Os04g0381500 [Oryza sativa Japonica Group]|uniref:cDNA clone:002-176-E02, full insert sequence n=3 Tax=Oryza sativa subsp. japonica TaxID=39947 RepID=Q0JDS0_ORYSJ|nr:hypothetical protein DAI22_04g102500 [Oryza sativa Japonica Group]BAF14517.1 Os04g0381500 [Oryza sativa Japonica Group]BAG99175.1 unnamed protein product [Oryza sativa Japonica Group]|eukprot:NP_001052603.1 Os04g0381500 [Oryza sativa Japonica Group]
MQIVPTTSDQPAGGESTAVVAEALIISRPPWEGGGVAGGAQAMSECMEKTLYTGPCLEALCTAACILELNNGGHCRGGFLFFKKCSCFLCF